jgi:hypothetical protein
MARPYSIAASSAVELPLVGPSHTATVVAATSQAAYVAVDDPDRTILCLAAADAVRVPCALVLQSKSLPPPPPEGTIGTVGGGILSLSGRSFRVARWWRPPRPRGLGAVPPARLAGAVRWLTGRVADPLDAPGRAAVALLRHAARGECVPQLADLLAAVAGGGGDPAAGALPRAAGALLAVGHCSGAGLLHGVIVALAIAHRRLANGVVPVPSAAAA